MAEINSIKSTYEARLILDNGSTVQLSGGHSHADAILVAEGAAATRTDVDRVVAKLERSEVAA